MLSTAARYAGGQGVATIFPGQDDGTVHSVTSGGTYVVSPAMLIDDQHELDATPDRLDEILSRYE